MYLPYLYGRQYELLAVRMLLDDKERDPGEMLPIIEPVMSNPRDLLRCVRECEEAGQPVAIVVNPHRHQLALSIARRTWQREVYAALEQSPGSTPAVVCGEDAGVQEIGRYLDLFPDREIAVVYQAGRWSPDDIRWIARQDRLRWHIVDVDHVSARLRAAMPRERLILLKDCFNKLARNADYRGREFFTDVHHGLYDIASGLSDYLCLGSQLKVGGFKAHAVAIHAVYRDRDDGDVWIEHFVSTLTSVDEGDVAGKLVDAAGKLMAAVRRRPREFGNNPALRDFQQIAESGDSPGLSVSKKLQMAHHMYLMMDVLEGRL
jgi:hypothetical protein